MRILILGLFGICIGVSASTNPDVDGLLYQDLRTRAMMAYGERLRKLPTVGTTLAAPLRARALTCANRLILREEWVPLRPVAEMYPVVTDAIDVFLDYYADQPRTKLTKRVFKDAIHQLLKFYFGPPPKFHQESSSAKYQSLR